MRGMESIPRTHEGRIAERGTGAMVARLSSEEKVPGSSPGCRAGLFFYTEHEKKARDTYTALNTTSFHRALWAHPIQMTRILKAAKNKGIYIWLLRMVLPRVSVANGLELGDG